MEAVGNAMTANYGDENDDGVCEHEEWELIFIDGEYEIEILDTTMVSCRVKCEVCGLEGWFAAPIGKEYDLEWD